MRKPGIHITEQALRNALDELDYHIADVGWTLLLKKLRTQQLTHRQLVLMDSKAKAAKLNGQGLADKAVSNSYAILANLRLQEHHIKIRPIRPSQPGWSDVVAAAEAAEAFSKRFNLTNGHLVYYQQAMKLLKNNFTLKSLSYNYDNICKSYSEHLEVANDTNRALTFELIENYTDRANLSSSWKTTLHSSPLHFVRTAELIAELKVTPHDWLECQFEAIAWTKTFPEPRNLYGEKALSIWLSTGKREKTGAEPKTNKQLQYEQMLKQKK